MKKKVFFLIYIYLSHLLKRFACIIVYKALISLWLFGIIKSDKLIAIIELKKKGHKKEKENGQKETKERKWGVGVKTAK